MASGRRPIWVNVMSERIVSMADMIAAVVVVVAGQERMSSKSWLLLKRSGPQAPGGQQQDSEHTVADSRGRHRVEDSSWCQQLPFRWWLK